MQIKAAIFDMDGTLIDSLFYWKSFWRDFGKKYLNQENFEGDEQLDKRVRTMIFKDVLTLLRNTYSLSCTEEELSAFASGSLASFYEKEATVKEGNQ